MSETIEAVANEAAEASHDAVIAESAAETAVVTAIEAHEEAAEATQAADEAASAAAEAEHSAAVANDLATQNAAQTLAIAFDRIAAAEIRSEEAWQRTQELAAQMQTLNQHLATLTPPTPLEQPEEATIITETPEGQVTITEINPEEEAENPAPVISQPPKKRYRLL